MATPIFVLGRHRSGTTWLANILGAHPAIFAPMHPAHHGVHESGYFSHLLRNCNQGRTEADLRRIQQLFESSDYFMLTGLESGPSIMELGAAGYFRAVMDAAAQRRGARFWLEKTPAHTLHARRLAAEFPDARFIAMTRRFADVVASNVHGFGDPASAASWFRHALGTAVYEKVLAANRVTAVSYADLKADTAGTVGRLLAGLGLPASPVPQSAYPPNTLRRGDPAAASPWRSLATQAGRLAIQPLPARWVEAAVVRWRDARTAALPPWFFRLQDGKST